MKLNPRLGSALLVLLVFNAAHAQPLVRVVENYEASTWIKTDTLKRAGSSVEFIQIMDFKSPKSNRNGELYSSIEQKITIDCRLNTQTINHIRVFSAHMLQGKLIASGAMSQKNQIPHGTSLESVRAFVCN
jgi:hypothetical protein